MLLLLPAKAMLSFPRADRDKPIAPLRPRKKLLYKERLVLLYSLFYLISFSTLASCESGMGHKITPDEHFSYMPYLIHLVI